MRNGHTEKDVTRLLSLPDVPDINDGDIISRQAAIDALQGRKEQRMNKLRPYECLMLVIMGSIWAKIMFFWR